MRQKTKAKTSPTRGRHALSDRTKRKRRRKAVTAERDNKSILSEVLKGVTIHLAFQQVLDLLKNAAARASDYFSP